jgi:hypothetical protein
MYASFVVINDSQDRGEKNRVSEHTVLEILFASDFELARVVALNPSVDTSNPYAQLLEEGPARSRLLDEEELVCRRADGETLYTDDR